ncbi:MAG: glycerate kinase, partial [Deltaproteobacteria bacterium]|nr:glycerate kinase [Nannocystaceae bacterium]
PISLEGLTDVALVAFATDGDDGSSGAAGAVVDGSSTARARARGFELTASLRTSDTASALAALGDLLVPGPTGTNVCDVVVVLGR